MKNIYFFLFFTLLVYEWSWKNQIIIKKGDYFFLSLSLLFLNWMIFYLDNPLYLIFFISLFPYLHFLSMVIIPSFVFPKYLLLFQLKISKYPSLLSINIRISSYIYSSNSNTIYPFHSHLNNQFIHITMNYSFFLF